MGVQCDRVFLAAVGTCQIDQNVEWRGFCLRLSGLFRRLAMALCERLRYLTGPLSGVEEFIGACQHFLWPLAHFVLLPSGGEGDRNLLAVPVDFQRAETSQHKLQLRQCALGKENEAFVAAQAHRQVGAPDDLIQTASKFPQYLVTGGMAVGIVDVLETVQVKREYGDRVSLALRASHFGGQALLSETPVIQTSQ